MQVLGEEPIMKNHNHEISYECHQCKSIIIEKPEDNFDLLLVMVKDAKPNTWLFECLPCNIENKQAE